MERVKRVVVTGSSGFVGRNLMQALSERDDLDVLGFDAGDDPVLRLEGLKAADVIVHLAGVNRPSDPAEFERGNAGSTAEICDALLAAGRTPKIVMSSSVQAALDNPYGVSKRMAEEILESFAARTGAEVVVYRFKNIFGKWSRPSYNSVVATFCHNVARDLPISVDAPERELELVYVDDVVARLVAEIDEAGKRSGFSFAPEMDGYRVTLGRLADMVIGFRAMRGTGVLPDLADPLVSRLYSTYASFLGGELAAYGLDVKSDDRGTLAEFVKSPHGGQIFVSRTLPGVTRGNHYHHSKTEKFLILEGSAVVRLRDVSTGESSEHRVEGRELKVVDIPPGATHSITNVGSEELVVLFWASEMFDPSHPDTFYREV